MQLPASNSSSLLQSSLPSSSYDPEAHLSIKIQSNDGHLVYFQVKNKTKFEKIFNAYAKKIGIHVGFMRFLFLGERVGNDQTPGDLELEDDDMIQSFVRQDGGGGDDQQTQDTSEEEKKVPKVEESQSIKKMIVELWDPISSKPYKSINVQEKDGRNIFYYIASANKKYMIRCKVNPVVDNDWCVGACYDGRDVNYYNTDEHVKSDGYVYFEYAKSSDIKYQHDLYFGKLQGVIMPESMDGNQRVEPSGGTIICTLYRKGIVRKVSSAEFYSQHNFITKEVSTSIPFVDKVKFYKEPGLITKLSREGKVINQDFFNMRTAGEKLETVTIKYDSAERLALRNVLPRNHPCYPSILKRHLPMQQVTIPKSVRNRWCDLTEIDSDNDDEEPIWASSKRVKVDPPILSSISQNVSSSSNNLQLLTQIITNQSSTLTDQDLTTISTAPTL